jgi:hypothetical protein
VFQGYRNKTEILSPGHYAVLDLWSDIFIIELRAQVRADTTGKFGSACNLNFKYESEEAGDACREIYPRVNK